MNLRIGKFGKQETTSVVLLATLGSGLFAVDNTTVYQNGNVVYLTSLVAMLASLLLFEALTALMARHDAPDLSALLRRLLGRVAGGIAAIALIGGLLLMALLPLTQHLHALTQYVYVDAKQVALCLYFLPCLAVLGWLGMETIARTCRLVLPFFLVALLLALWMGHSQYALFRLFPFPGDSAAGIARQSVSALFRFFTPLLALLTIGSATQCVQNLRTAGRIGLLAGGGLAAVAQFFLGMMFQHTELQSQIAPLYRFLSEVCSDTPLVRSERMLLFVWVIAGLLVAAFYVYAAALLFAKLYGVGDIRPIAFLFSTLTVSVLLLLHYDSSETVHVLQWLFQNGWCLVVAPILLLLPFGLFKRREAMPCDA